MLCVNNDCRHELEPDSRFCTECGSPQLKDVGSSSPGLTIRSVPPSVSPTPLEAHEAKARESVDGQESKISVITDDFDLIRDFAKINWSATGRVNIIRAVFAGPVLGFLAAFASGSAKIFFIYALFFPVIYVVALVPLALLGYYLRSVGVKHADFLTLALSFFVALGDPFTSMLAKKCPDFISLDNFSSFNLKPILFVLSSAAYPSNKILDAIQRALTLGQTAFESARANRAAQLSITKEEERRASAAAQAQSNELQGARDWPEEVDFLFNAAEVTAADAVLDIFERANDLSNEDTRRAILLYNAALRMNPSAAQEIAIHANRSQAIAKHFEIDGRNKTSHRLSHVIAREHLIRDWEAIIGLWAENAASFGEAEEGLKPIFDHVYVNYMPISCGLWTVEMPDGQIKEYEARIPKTWDIAWVPEGLLVNGRLHSEYKFEKPKSEQTAEGLRKYGCAWASVEAADKYKQILFEQIANGGNFGRSEALTRFIELGDDLIRLEGRIPNSFIVAVDLGEIYSTAAMMNARNEPVSNAFIKKAEQAWSVASNHVEAGNPKDAEYAERGALRSSYMGGYWKTACQIGFARYLQTDCKDLRHLRDITVYWANAVKEGRSGGVIDIVGKHIRDKVGRTK